MNMVYQALLVEGLYLPKIFVIRVAILSDTFQYGFTRSSHSCAEQAFNTEEIVLKYLMIKYIFQAKITKGHDYMKGSDRILVYLAFNF